MPEWRKYKLENFAKITSSKRIYYSDYVDEGVPFYRSKEIIEKYQGKSITTKLYISNEKYKQIKSKFGVPLKNDLLITSVGTIGIPYLVKKKDKFYFKDGNLTWLRNLIGFVFPEYLFYWIQSSIGKQKLTNSIIGSTQKALTIEALKKISIVLPPLSEQHRIAEILGALDDKIELNLEINKTLEEMAMAIYKEWFVDFGPFRDGEFVDSELGQIPKGWEVQKFFDIADLLSGGTPKTSVSEFWNGGIKWVSAKDIGNSSQVMIMATEKKITPLGMSNSSTKLLPKYTVIVVARGSVGKFGMIIDDMCMNQSCYGIYGKSNYGQPFIYLMISFFMDFLKRVSYGSVFDTITTATFKTMNLALPCKDLMHQFNKHINPLFKLIESNTVENHFLKQTRDYLLPKLISGEVRVKAAEEKVKEVL